MNLLTDRLLLFRLRDGTRKLMTPSEGLTNSDVVDIAYDRADLHRATLEFLIALLQTFFAPEDIDEWVELFTEPPSKEALDKAFTKGVGAFHLTGDGSLFMQDKDDLSDQKELPIERIFIDSPAENTVKKNKDHFVKRGRIEKLSLGEAAMALYCLQSNAPSGGVGHRVGLRGGGPVSTIVKLSGKDEPVWRQAYVNVLDRESLVHEATDYSSSELFPWLGDTKTSEKKGSEVYSNEVHPLHVYWAMPRRIRISATKGTASSSITGLEVEEFVSSFRMKNYGNNYEGDWDHPLSPKRFDPKKPEKGTYFVKGDRFTSTYRSWPSFSFINPDKGFEPALVVGSFDAKSDCLESEYSRTPRISIFAFDMDNMDPKGQHSSEMPLMQIPKEKQEQVHKTLRDIHGLAMDALGECRKRIKLAAYSKQESKGDFSTVDLEYYRRTESDFFKLVTSAVQSDDNSLSGDQARYWVRFLKDTTLAIFDALAVPKNFSEGDNLTKIIENRIFLLKWFSSSKNIKTFIATFCD